MRLNTHTFLKPKPKKMTQIKSAGINVLSLFNGMGTLRQAFFNLGIKVNKYYSSEIKKYAIELQQYHFPDVIQVGDISNWEQWDIDWGNIDFIGSGSPCQDLSVMGKRAGINGSKSSLFFTFVEILNHVKKLNPNVKFLQENVASASKLDVGTMSRSLGLYPVRLNSKLLVAQSRDRYYWSNIKTKKTMFDIVTDIPTPQNTKILLQDILESGVVTKTKSNALLERYIGACPKSDEALQRFLKNRIDFGSYCEIIEDGKYRVFTKIEMCRLQGFPDNYCEILNEEQTGSLIGDGWTLPMIEHILSFYEIK